MVIWSYIGQFGSHVFSLFAIFYVTPEIFVTETSNFTHNSFYVLCIYMQNNLADIKYFVYLAATFVPIFPSFMQLTLEIFVIENFKILHTFVSMYCA